MRAEALRLMALGGASSCLVFRYSFIMMITIVRANVTALAIIIGQFQINTPSVNQNATPTANVICIHSETVERMPPSLMSLLFPKRWFPFLDR
jgi:hypothetical protein